MFRPLDLTCSRVRRHSPRGTRGGCTDPDRNSVRSPPRKNDRPSYSTSYGIPRRASYDKKPPERVEGGAGGSDASVPAPREASARGSATPATPRARVHRSASARRGFFTRGRLRAPGVLGGWFRPPPSARLGASEGFRVGPADVASGEPERASRSRAIAPVARRANVRTRARPRAHPEGVGAFPTDKPAAPRRGANRAEPRSTPDLRRERAVVIGAFRRAGRPSSA